MSFAFWKAKVTFRFFVILFVSFFLVVNEIIGRDMSQISVSHGTAVASQSAHTCPGSLETRISDGIQ